MPSDLEKALRGNAEARAAYDTMPPSHKREYVEWITEAKRESTRRQRMDKALAMMVGWGRQRQKRRKRSS